MSSIYIIKLIRPNAMKPHILRKVAHLRSASFIIYYVKTAYCTNKLFMYKKAKNFGFQIHTLQSLSICSWWKKIANCKCLPNNRTQDFKWESSPISESAGALMLIVRCILQMQGYCLSGCAIFLVHKLLYSTADDSLSMRKYIKDNIYIFFRNAFVFSLLIMYAVIVYVNF